MSAQPGSRGGLVRVRRLAGWPLRRLLDPRAEWIVRDVSLRLEQRLDSVERDFGNRLDDLARDFGNRLVALEQRQVERHTELLREVAAAAEAVGARGQGLAALLDTVRGLQDEVAALRWRSGAGEGDVDRR